MTLEEELRLLIVEGEDLLSHGRDGSSGHRAALRSHYLGYMKSLTRSKRPKTVRAEDYLRVVRAARDADAVADLAAAPGAAPTLDGLVRSPLRQLDALLTRVASTAVLIVESGDDCLTLFAMLGGAKDLESRIALERGGASLVEGIVALLRQQLRDIERIAAKEKIDGSFHSPIEEAGRAAWQALPAPIRSIIGEVDTLLFMPSSYGDLSAVPLELFLSEQGWLGNTHAIARLSSMRTLFELLSPNRMPQRLEPRATIVRSRDAKGLTRADAEVADVNKQLAAMQMATTLDLMPSRASVRGALDAGSSVLHYCGHGFAGQFAEALPLGADQALGPPDFSQLSGSGMPVVYLSTCQVGQSRMASTGNAIGISARLIEKGAPAVIGCLQPIPDAVAREMAVSFYGEAATHAVGSALSRARARPELQRYPPACWGAFALFGDPRAHINPSAAARQMRQATRRWDSYVGRYLATRSAECRSAALEALEKAREEKGAPSELLRSIAGWLERSFQSDELEVKQARLEHCTRLAERDTVAACELRMLLAMETINGSYFGERKPSVVFCPDEVQVGIACAGAIHDTIAYCAFAIEGARFGEIFGSPRTVLRMLEEAIGALQGWQNEEREAQKLLAQARALKARLIAEHAPA